MAMRLGRDGKQGSRAVSGDVAEHHEVAGAALIPGRWEAAAGDGTAGGAVSAAHGTGDGVAALRPEAGPAGLPRPGAATAGPAPAARDGEALQALGRSLAEEGRQADAVAALRHAVLAFHGAGDHARLAGALTDWGICLAAAGHCDAAITAHEASLELMREHGNWRGEGIAHGNLGVALSGAGRYAEAATAFDRAAALLLAAGDEARSARALADKEQARALARSR